LLQNGTRHLNTFTVDLQISPNAADISNAKPNNKKKQCATDRTILKNYNLLVLPASHCIITEIEEIN
jgi:hypothetical protein